MQTPTSNKLNCTQLITHTTWVAEWKCKLGSGIGNEGWRTRDRRPCAHSRPWRSLGQQRMRRTAKGSSGRLRKQWEAGSWAIWTPVVSFLAVTLLLITANSVPSQPHSTVSSTRWKTFKVQPRIRTDILSLKFLLFFPKTFYAILAGCKSTDPSCLYVTRCIIDLSLYRSSLMCAVYLLTERSLLAHPFFLSFLCQSITLSYVTRSEPWSEAHQYHSSSSSYYSVLRGQSNIR